MLKLDSIVKSYPDGEISEKRVLDCVSLELGKGEVVAITGPSGSGKSTLLNISGGLDRPDSGSVFIDGFDISTMNDRQIAEFRLNKIGFIFQEHHLLPQCTVLENILVPTIPERSNARLLGEPAKFATELLTEFGILSKRNSFPCVLSGGEKQRVAIIRAMINRPRLVLADEPTGLLDKANAFKTLDMLLELRKTFSVTVLFVTHSSELAGRADRTFSLSLGRLELCAPQTTQK